MWLSMPKHLPSVCRRRYSFVRWLECEMNKPPFWIHPESNPVSDSKLINKSRVVASSWISTSLGRSRQTKPAVCHVVPVGFVWVLWTMLIMFVLIIFTNPLSVEHVPGAPRWHSSWSVDTKCSLPPIHHLRNTIHHYLFIAVLRVVNYVCTQNRQLREKRSLIESLSVSINRSAFFFSRSINFLFTQMISGRVTVWLRAEHHRVGVGRCKQSGGLRGRILIATMKTTKETSWEVPDGTWDRFWNQLRELPQEVLAQAVTLYFDRDKSDLELLVISLAHKSFRSNRFSAYSLR